MMLKSLFAHLLILVVATQSVIALADVHQSHQSGDQHLTFVHEHDLKSIHPDPVVESEHPLDSQFSTDFDCHHCCHCHGGHSPWLNNTGLFMGERHSAINPVGYRITSYTAPSETQFRPPRS